MEMRTAQELGFLGTNVDQNLTLDYVHFELIQKAEQGDKTSVFKLHQIARHYVGENQEAIRKFAVDGLTRLGELEAEDTEPDEGVEGGQEGSKEPDDDTLVVEDDQVG